VLLYVRLIEARNGQGTMGDRATRDRDDIRERNLSSGLENREHSGGSAKLTQTAIGRPS